MRHYISTTLTRPQESVEPAPRGAPGRAETTPGSVQDPEQSLPAAKHQRNDRGGFDTYLATGPAQPKSARAPQGTRPQQSVEPAPRGAPGRVETTPDSVRYPEQSPPVFEYLRIDWSGFDTGGASYLATGPAQPTATGRPRRQQDTQAQEPDNSRIPDRSGKPDPQ
ncbi:hypothetical protein G7085_07895 [Tessaracoccus sp. HDW20]|uniref:hypothetical protein n=1 Tax=Tessaracoccus coleopterorum TaxID=2714950 RepID=UPI0018D4D392|nr:hypothetical protein [Tessaracoccus coleopterorum]NHB84558.1 hypothetical protein [Tessaracoccus coleopterorum]